MDGIQMTDKTQQDFVDVGESAYGVAEKALLTIKRNYDEALASELLPEGSVEREEIRAYRRSVKGQLVTLRATHALQTVMMKRFGTRFGGK